MYGQYWVLTKKNAQLGRKRSKARNFKFRTEMDGSEHWRKKIKTGHVRVTWPTFGILGIFEFCEFWDPPDISGMKKTKLDQTQRWMAVSTNEKNAKNRSKGVSLGSRDPLSEFMDPLISPERLKLETSNLTHGRMTVSLTKKCKIESKGFMSGHVTLL